MSGFYKVILGFIHPFFACLYRQLSQYLYVKIKYLYVKPSGESMPLYRLESSHWKYAT